MKTARDAFMIERPNSSEEGFQKIVKALLRYPNVTPPQEDQLKRRFGSTGLKIHNKIFAMLVRGRLVVKLPRVRVDALVESKDGERFDPRHDGRLM